MVTGKSSWFCLPIVSLNQSEPMGSQMETQIAPDALLLNVGRNAARVCLIAKHIMLMFVATLAFKMEAGSREFTPEFTEISEQ